MANWVADWLEREDDSRYPIAIRARHALHVREPSGLMRGYFTGAPCHYWDGEWKALDTALRLGADGRYGAPGIPISITADGLVVPTGTGYSQLTTRAGIYDPAARTFSGVVTLPRPRIDGDRLVSGGTWWEHEVRLTETGVRETLTILERPNVGARVGEWLLLETHVSGLSVPDSELGEFSHGGYRFPPPRVWDADMRKAQAKRWYRDGRLYTGVPVEWLATARYPVVIDPDFAGSTADGRIYGSSATYDTARSTRSSYDVTASSSYVGQRLSAGVYTINRHYLKFDTSSIPDDDTITQVNIKLTVLLDYSVTDFDVQIVKQDWSGQDPIGSANAETAYDNCLSGTADNNIWRNTSGIAGNTPYTSGNLSTSWPSKASNTYWSLRSDRDYSNTAPSGDELLLIFTREASTAAYRPVAVIAHEAAAAVKRYLTLLGVGR